MKKVIAILITVICMACSRQAYAYSIDGNLSDWGVTPGVYGGSDWTPNVGVQYVEEDQTGDFDAFLGPGTGGQTFDAEAMYLDYDGTNLYYAVVTGIPQEGIEADGMVWLPGDVGFDFGDGYSYAIAVPDHWISETGSIFDVNPLTDWDMGSWPDESGPTKLKGYNTLIASGSLAYTLYDAANQHWIIEGSIPLDSFGSDWGKTFNMHWTQTCGNDAIDLFVPIPEPATLSLFGIGLLGLLAKRRKNK